MKQQEEDKEWAQIAGHDMVSLSKIFGVKCITVNNEYGDDTALNIKLLETLSEPLDETQLSKLSRSEKVVLIMDMEKYEANMSRGFWSDDIPPWDDNQQRYINAIWRKFREIKRNDIQASRGQAVGAVGSGPEGVGEGDAGTRGRTTGNSDMGDDTGRRDRTEHNTTYPVWNETTNSWTRVPL